MPSTMLLRSYSGAITLAPFILSDCDSGLVPLSLEWVRVQWDAQSA